MQLEKYLYSRMQHNYIYTCWSLCWSCDGGPCNVVHPNPLRLFRGQGVLHSREQHSWLTIHNLDERLKHIHRQMLRMIRNRGTLHTIRNWCPSQSTKLFSFFFFFLPCTTKRTSVTCTWLVLATGLSLIRRLFSWSAQTCNIKKIMID